MNHEAITAADPGTPTILPFPFARPRAPKSIGSMEEGREAFEHAFIASHVAQQFDEEPDRLVRAMLYSDEGDGPHAVSRMLEHNAQAIAFLRAALAGLIAADHRIATAADRAVAEAGL